MEEFVKGLDAEKAAKDREIAMLRARIDKLERFIFIKKEIEEIDEALEYDLASFVRNLLKRYRAMLEEDLDD